MQILTVFKSTHCKCLFISSQRCSFSLVSISTLNLLAVWDYLYNSSKVWILKHIQCHKFKARNCVFSILVFVISLLCINCTDVLHWHSHTFIHYTLIKIAPSVTLFSLSSLIWAVLVGFLMLFQRDLLYFHICIVRDHELILTLDPTVHYVICCKIKAHVILWKPNWYKWSDLIIPLVLGLG